MVRALLVSYMLVNHWTFSDVLSKRCMCTRSNRHVSLCLVCYFWEHDKPTWTPSWPTYLFEGRMHGGGRGGVTYRSSHTDNTVCSAKLSTFSPDIFLSFSLFHHLLPFVIIFSSFNLWSILSLLFPALFYLFFLYQFYRFYIILFIWRYWILCWHLYSVSAFFVSIAISACNRQI